MAVGELIREELQNLPMDLLVFLARYIQSMDGDGIQFMQARIDEELVRRGRVMTFGQE